MQELPDQLKPKKQKDNDDLPEGVSEEASSDNDQFGGSSQPRLTQDGSQRVPTNGNAFTPIPGNHLNDYENQYSTLEPMQHLGTATNINDASLNNESPQQENK